MQQIVKPIKDSWVLKSVQNELKNSTFTGQRDYTIFQVGKSTLLRVSDVLKLKKSDVFDHRGRVKKNAYIIDKKTKKQNILYLRPVERDLEDYYDWLEEKEQEFYHPTSESQIFVKKFTSKNLQYNGHVFSSPWLFPSFNHAEKPIDGKSYWRIMNRVGKKLHLDYLGTHTMRKTGAYRVYQQTHHNIALVMKLLNHSSEEMTLAYLGLDQETRENILDTIDFG